MNCYLIAGSGFIPPHDWKDTSQTPEEQLEPNLFRLCGIWNPQPSSFMRESWELRDFGIGYFPNHAADLSYMPHNEKAEASCLWCNGGKTKLPSSEALAFLLSPRPNGGKAKQQETLRQLWFLTGNCLSSAAALRAGSFKWAVGKGSFPSWPLGAGVGEALSLKELGRGRTRNRARKHWVETQQTFL